MRWKLIQRFLIEYNICSLYVMRAMPGNLLNQTKFSSIKRMKFRSINSFVHKSKKHSIQIRIVCIPIWLVYFRNDAMELDRLFNKKNNNNKMLLIKKDIQAVCALHLLHMNWKFNEIFKYHPNEWKMDKCKRNDRESSWWGTIYVCWLDEQIPWMNFFSNWRSVDSVKRSMKMSNKIRRRLRLRSITASQVIGR